MIPIHSLPQEWLWCESWCSDGSKASAKTIDLCNNPRYKEPKLDMARRVINGTLFPESWDALDAEVAAAEAEWKAGLPASSPPPAQPAPVAPPTASTPVPAEPTPTPAGEGAGGKKKAGRGARPGRGAGAGGGGKGASGSGEL
jgi:hypothetical protein